MEWDKLRQTMVVHGNTEKWPERMGHYKEDGEVNGSPKYTCTWYDKKTPELEAVVLYRGKSGRWMVGNESSIKDNLGSFISVQTGSSLPLGLDWRIGIDGKWHSDDKLTVQSLNMYVEEGPCFTLEISGLTGGRKFTMGNYRVDGSFNGHPKFKSSHLWKKKALFIYRTKDGFWDVSDNPEGFLGFLRSSSAGASIPLGLHWKCLQNGKYIMDDLITVRARYSWELPEIENKQPEVDIIFMNSEKKVPETDNVIPSMSNTIYKIPSKICSKSFRGTNRMGDGLGDPLRGKKIFFPESWSPSKSVLESLAPFALSEKEIDMVRDKGKRLEVEANFVDLNVSADYASAIYAYTLEDNCIYKKLNKACRTESSINKRLLKVYRNYLYHVNEAATQLPNFKGRTYRSISTRLPPRMYPIGETITWHQLSSSSVKADITTAFLEKSNDGTIEGSVFVLDVKTGKEISMFSEFPDEEEVLLRINTFFKVARKFEGEEEKREAIGEKAAFNVGNMKLVDVYHLVQL